MISLAAALVILGTASAMPAGSSTLVRRADNVGACKDNGCTDCPLFFGAGSGWPNCPLYPADQLKDAGYPLEENGMVKIFLDVPPQDQGCRTLIRTPVRPTDQDCGGQLLVLEGETCAPIVIDSSFIAAFCCGTGDCTAAGAPGRSPNNPFRAGSSGVLLLHDKYGNVIEPQTAELLQAPLPRDAVASSVSPVALASRRLTKRDCGNFKVTREAYQSGGTNYIISDTVTCGATEGCSATISESVTEEASFSVELSVSDPLGIVSASAGFEFSQSVTQEFSGTWEFGPGERGYVVFIPYITCVEGYFEGDCDDDGKQVTVCSAEGGENQIKGERRAVLIRGT